MPQLLPLFRAARLVGATRGALQKKIQAGELPAFEGMVAMDDLLRVFPKPDLGYDSEYERIQNIKSSAFARRVRERLLPDAHVLARRVAELGRDLAVTHGSLRRHQQLLADLQQRLNKSRDRPTKKDIEDIMAWLADNLQSATSSHPADELLAQDTVLRIMAAHIRIHPSNHEFWLEGTDTLLDAGVRAGLALNYGCTGGNCGLCKARVMRGEVKKTRPHDYVLSEAEKNMGYILMCSNTAVTDVVLEALEASGEHDIPLQEIVTKVKGIDRSHPEVLILHLQTPRAQRLRFLAGQSVNLSLPNGMKADFPIASCPCDDRNILFHVAQDGGSRLAQELAQNIRQGDEITVIGPQGDFLFRDTSKHAPIFLAFGIGFAPIKSLIEHAMALDVAAMHLYWAVEKESALYANNLCRSWDDALEDFHYHPLVGHDAVATILAQHHMIEACDVYLAGPGHAVKHAGQRLLEAGLPDDQLITLSL
jgi:CDP-4-dehydro-6-deoxyglucose reductase